MPPEWRAESWPPSITAYEALQPPLYYWMMARRPSATGGYPRTASTRAKAHPNATRESAKVLRLMPGGLAVQVLAMRWLSALIASLSAAPFRD